MVNYAKYTDKYLIAISHLKNNVSIHTIMKKWYNLSPVSFVYLRRLEISELEENNMPMVYKKHSTSVLFLIIL